MNKCKNKVANAEKHSGKNSAIVRKNFATRLTPKEKKIIQKQVKGARKSSNK